MARLCQLRLVSIGHANARFGDVTLDFTRAGVPADSTIWLRNGGGKSSLLSLFFGLVRPDLREFLGAQADARQRRLDQYVSTTDRAVVVAEWELDDDGAGSPPPRLLTGAFYEWRTGTGELRKLWFSGLVSAAEHRLTLAGLPLLSEAGRRRTLVSFKEEWATLRTRWPEQQLTATEVQREWADRLRGVGIDPELFSYQVRMNTREGGADELFRFSDHEAFVDFLLELAFPVASANEVSKNVAQYREQLRLRKEEYLPERALVAALVAAMQPLATLAGERARQLAAAARGRVELVALDRHLEARLVTVTGDQDAARQQAEAAEHARQVAEERARLELRRAATLAWFAATGRHAHAVAERDEVEQRHKQAEARRRLWAAARPLRDALRHEAAAEQLRGDLERSQVEHQPLHIALRETAVAFAGALDAAATSERVEQRRDLDQDAVLRARVRDLRDLAARRRSDAEQHQRQAALFEQTIVHARRERDRLVHAGIVGAEESTESAAARILERAADEERAAARWGELAGELEKVALTIRDQIVGFERELGGLEASLGATKLELERASAERHALEARPLLARLLECERVDLESAGDGVELRLDEAIAAVRTRLIERRSASAADERVRRHLEVDGLLPPSPEVATLVAHLASRIPGVRSGWKEIATNGPSALEARRAMVMSHPHLATGVIVRDADWQRACALLAAAPPPEVPVVLAPQGAFEAPPISGFVVGPATDAHFDRAAAAREAARRNEIAAQLEAEIAAAESELSQLESLRDAHRVFRGRYPLGWLVEKAAELADRNHELAEPQADLTDKRDSLLAAERRRSEAERQRGDCLERLHVTRRSLNEVESFQRQHSAGWPAAERGLVDASAAAEGLLREVETLAVDVGVTEDAAMHRARSAHEHGEKAARLEQERTRVRYLDAEVIALPGDVAALGALYEQRLAVYEQKVGAEGLVLARRREEDAAQAARQRLKDVIRAPLTEVEVATALAGLVGAEEVEALEEKASREAQSLFGHFGNVSQELSRRASVLAAAERRCQELEAPLRCEQPVAGPEHALEESRLAEAEAGVAERDAAAAATRASAARELERAAREAQAALRAIAQRVGTLAENWREHFPGDESTGLASVFPGDTDLGALAGDLEVSLRSLRAEARVLDGRRLSAAKQVHAIAAAPEHERLQSMIPRRFRAFDEVTLEAQATDLLTALEDRARILDAEIAGLELHRAVLVKEALGVASEALRLLRDAERQSRLPAHLTWGGGEAFLRITTSAPDAPAEREARMAELIDQLAVEGNIPGGIGFVQRALRRLARPIRVKVMFPDPGLGTRIVDIPETARFSGGEQLTCAILLYCTLAQLRAKRRAAARRPSSVLLLDNPIGRASRASFLELQREVARAMGIQLVYTTGVEDLEAIRALPNVIRLRNERIDRNSGHQVVEVLEGGAQDGVRGQVVAARLARLELPPPTGHETAHGG